MAALRGAMYPQQVAAFSARELFTPRVTASTADSPPPYEGVDWAALAALKSQVVSQLPTHCTHCKTATVKVVERSVGEIVAYCDGRGCGKSLVLFAPPVNYNRKPVWTQHCVYQSVNGPHAGLPPAVPSMLVPCDPDEPQQRQQVEHGMPQPSPTVPTALWLEQPQQTLPLQVPHARPMSLLDRARAGEQLSHAELMQMHGVPADDPCRRCQTPRSQHNLQVDHHGWVISGYTDIPYPSGWPMYHAETRTWSPVAVCD